MDRNKLAAAIVERGGPRLDPDDPAFILVDLNRMVLEESAFKVAEQIGQAADKFGAITTRNVDDFVSVANEALSKFIHRTNELKSVLDGIKAVPIGEPARSTPIVAAPPAPIDPKEALGGKLWAIIAGSFLGGVVVGVLITAIVALK